MKAALVFSAILATAAAQPNIANDWSSFVISDLVQNQGNYELSNGDLCCSAEATDCQVQVQSQGGQVYWSLSQNATTQVFGAAYQPYAIVSDYHRHKEMAVDENFVCQSFCPMPGPMEPYNVQGYTDMGKANICTDTGACVDTELWQQLTVFPLGNITMETDNIYVNQTNYNNAIPVIEIDTLTPFGEYVGQSNTTYQNFVAGPQSPKWFNVSGIDACQEDSQCNSNTRMMHRIQTRSKTAFLHHFFAARVAKAQKEAKDAQIKLAALTASA